ncbi:MAG: putative acetyltransferase [Saprospiraceae bacterium]|jgi:putative acetyltransferase
MKNIITIKVVDKTDNLILAKIIRDVFIEHDAPQQGTVYSDPTTDDLYQYFKIQKSILWVAELNGEIAGCCGIYPTEGLAETCTELVKFYIHQSTRGKGVGKALMEKCVESALEFGYKEMYLESLPHFAKAVNIYEKQGFKTLNQPLGNSGHTTCNIWMLKSLA